MSDIQQPSLAIYSQGFSPTDNKRIFCIIKVTSNDLFNISAEELFFQSDMLSQFTLHDIRVIALAAAECMWLKERKQIQTIT